MDKLIGVLPVKGRTLINPYLLPGGEMMEIKIHANGNASFKSASPSCVFCGRLSTFQLKGKYVCDNCRKQAKEITK